MLKRLRLILAVVGISSAPLARGAEEKTDPAAPDHTSRILTPPAPATPRINGPRIYGQRPGRPFLYTVPATGAVSVTVGADGPVLSPCL